MNGRTICPPTIAPLLALWVALGGPAACGGPHGAYSPRVPAGSEAARDAAFALERAGRTTEALEGYRVLCEGAEPSARACYDRARLLLESGALEAGRTASAAFLRRFPGNALAQPAIKRLARSWADAGDRAGGIAALEALAAELAATGAGDSVDREIARLHEGAGDLAGERAALERIAARGRWGSQLWDDAVWRLGLLARGQRDAEEEERQLRRLAEAWESSRLIGTSTSPYHGRALLRLGSLRAERGDPQGALAILLELGRIETSRERDDALFEAARIRLTRGDPSGACDLLRRVLEIRDASAGRRALELHGEIGCDRGGR